MNQYVLDASAVLAALRGEDGAEQVSRIVEGAVIGSVNYAEVAGGLVRYGNDSESARIVLDELALTVIPSDRELALQAGFLLPVTAPFGLSLGDRFCLALGRRMALPVVTADREWRKIGKQIGVAIDLIR